MAVSHSEVKHVAELARLTVSDARLDELAAELNGILVHMDVLARLDTSGLSAPSPAPGCTHLRSDSSGPIPLMAPREAFAPSIREGFFTVPRLATHEVTEAADAAGPTP